VAIEVVVAPGTVPIVLAIVVVVVLVLLDRDVLPVMVVKDTVDVDAEV